jgi:hypothetical protein
MKKIALLVVVGIFIFPFGFYGFYRWDSAKNRGNEFGYWGDFNRTKNALASIPGVTLTRKWHHLDLTLEEFGFEVMTNGCRVNVWFGESDEVRNLSRRRAIPVLKKMISERLTNSVPHETLGIPINQESFKDRQAE